MAMGGACLHFLAESQDVCLLAHKYVHVDRRLLTWLLRAPKNEFKKEEMPKNNIEDNTLEKEMLLMELELIQFFFYAKNY